MNSIETALRSSRRGNLLVRTWHWRYETGLVTGAGVVALFVWSTLGTTGLIACAAAALALLVVALACPPLRAWLIARAWCVITPHRIRTGCTQAWVQTRDGRLPAVLYTVPTPYGERLLVWCRAGITPGDLIAAREILRTACWAADVRVIVNERRSHIVVLEVIRRWPPDRPPGGQPGRPERPYQDRGAGGYGPGDDETWDDDGIAEAVVPYAGLGLPRPFG